MTIPQENFNPFGDMTFGEWLGVTKTEEEVAFGHDFTNFEGERLTNWYCQMLHGASAEIIEMGDEFGYKEWDSKAPWVNRERAISEAADVLHFLGLLLSQIECTGAELSDAYMATVAKNYRRQALKGGDDVKARRCGGCGRSLDDVGTFQDIQGEGEQAPRRCNHCFVPVREN